MSTTGEGNVSEMDHVAGGGSLPPPESPMRETVRMFFRNYAAVAGAVVLLVVVAITLVGPYLYTVDPFDIVWQTPAAVQRPVWLG